MVTGAYEVLQRAEADAAPAVAAMRGASANQPTAFTSRLPVTAEDKAERLAQFKARMGAGARAVKRG